MAHIVLVGAGSIQFGLGTLGDIFCTKTLYGSTITLLDINANAVKKVHKQSIDFLQQNDRLNEWGFIIKSSTDRKQAFCDADFIIISIEVGNRFDLWDMDRTIPQQYGIRQVYGENGGPGGTFHALRIIPPILGICADVQKICPEATVFNYSNPMSRICTTVHRMFPQLKFIGLCHEVASLERYMPKMLDVDFSDLDIVTGGLNHFSVILEAKDKNNSDIYPEIKEKALDFFKSVPSYGDFLAYQEKHEAFIETEGSTVFEEQVDVSRQWAERGLFKYIIEKFDVIPITTDSHFGEYIAWAHDVVDHRGILDFYRYYKKHLGSEAEHKIELKRKERVAVIMEAMLSGEEYIESAVNIPNKNYIKELPPWICVEVPARIGKNSINGIAVPELPKAFAGLLTNQIAVHDMNADAVLQQSKKAVIQTLLLDPVVDVCRNIEEMVDLMIDCQKEFLGYLR